VDIGLPVTKKYFYDTYGIPEPQEGEELIQIFRNTPLNPLLIEGRRTEFSEGKQFTPEQQAIEGLKNSTVDNWEEMLQPMLDPVIQIIKESSTLEEVKAKIMEAFGIMDDAKVSELLARAIFMSDMYGRLTGEKNA
jgi:phage gp29-like protein